jgi:4-amino-4-deoxy-L-arabinose transferase-like glycosyltransferase
MSEILKTMIRPFKGSGGILFVLALVVYFPGIWWGVTPAHSASTAHPWGTDELAPMQAVTELYGIFLAHQPVFNPQYPPVQNLVQALMMGPYLLIAWLLGGLSHPQPLYPFGFRDPATALQITTYLARAASLLMGAGAVLTAYRTGVVLWDRLMGLYSALLVLFLYPMVYYARVSNVDMGALFWSAIGLYVFAVCLRDGITQRRMVWLGILAAIATATKDASWAAFFMMAVVLAWRELRQPPAVRGAERIRPLLLGLLSAIVAYLVASGLVFRPSRFVAHVRWLTGNGLTPGWREAPTLEGYLRLTGKILMSLVEAFGAPTAICVIVGLVLCIFRKRLTPAWVLPAMGIVLFVLFPARYVQMRFVIVPAYVLVFFAAFALREVNEYRTIRKFAPLLLILLPGWQALRAADLTWQMIRDSRYDAGVWLKQHARSGDRLLHFVTGANLPPLGAGIRNVQASRDGSYRFTRTPEDPEFVILVPFSFISADPPHESNLVESEYQVLTSGEAGYQEVFHAQTPRLFVNRPLSWVNPVVRLFARKDIMAQR